MAKCPDCKKDIPAGATGCSHCGREFRGDELEEIQTRTSTWQKIVIAVGLVVLIAIGFTFMGAENRENKAAEHNFAQPLTEIINAMADESRLGREFGNPRHTLKADTKSAEVDIEFPGGPIPPDQAEIFAKAVCVGLARTFVGKGYIPRSIIINLSSAAPGGKKFLYGKVVYNGDKDIMTWERATK